MKHNNYYIIYNIIYTYNFTNLLLIYIYIYIYIYITLTNILNYLGNTFNTIGVIFNVFNDTILDYIIFR